MNVVRWAKILLVAAVALFFALVVFNNLTDFNSNYQFVRHVLRMDTTFPGNSGLWRALPWSTAHLIFYWGIIAWETATAALLVWGSVRLLRARQLGSAEFREACNIAVAGLVLSLLLWLVAFLAVGGEWFLMWQSAVWNGQQAAGRNFMVSGLVLLILLQPEV